MACPYTGDYCSFPDDDVSCGGCSGREVPNCRFCSRLKSGRAGHICSETGRRKSALNNVCSDFLENCCYCVNAINEGDSDSLAKWKCKLNKKQPTAFGYIDVRGTCKARSEEAHV